MTMSSLIIPMRFRIEETYLRDLAIAFSPFSYEQDCKNFQANMEQLYASDHPEYPPYNRLNTVLTALAPMLTYPFMYQWNADTRQSERQMLVVGTDVARRPKPEQISDLAYEWGKQWGDSTFKKVVEGAGRDAHQRLLDRLRKPIQHRQDTHPTSLFPKLHTTSHH